MLVGVTGGIAAYKSAELVRRLAQAGAETQVVLTENASRFVGPVTFEALTGRPVRESLWSDSLAHIELGRWADAIVVAPATANVMARLSAGIADDLLTAILLAAPKRALLAPAMNVRMYEHPATQKNLATLRAFGHPILGPAYGELAEREAGWGRMEEPEVILAHVGRLLEEGGRWSGRHAVVTSGPTWEPIDAVRFIANRSSGRMGHAIASAAWRRAARVTLISGPVQLPVPPGIQEVIRVETAEQMGGALRERSADADAIFMVAAVGDFMPADPSSGKLRRSGGIREIPVTQTPDLLATAAAATPERCVKVAFAVELGSGGVEAAREKLRAKGADIVLLNDPTESGAGFEVETNRVTVITADAVEELPLMSKLEVADEILDRVERLLPE